MQWLVHRPDGTIEAVTADIWQLGRTDVWEPDGPLILTLDGIEVAAFEVGTWTAIGAVLGDES